MDPEFELSEPILLRNVCEPSYYSRVYHHSISEHEELSFPIDCGRDFLSTSSDESGIVSSSSSAPNKRDTDLSIQDVSSHGSSQPSPTDSFTGVRQKYMRLDSSVPQDDTPTQRRRSKSDTPRRTITPMRYDMKTLFSHRIRCGRQRVRRISEGSFFANIRRRRDSIAEEESGYSSSMDAKSASRDQRNSLNLEYDRSRLSSDSPIEGDPSTSPSSFRAKKSSMKQFFENFRPRAKSENAQSLPRPSRRGGDTASSASSGSATPVQGDEPRRSSLETDNVLAPIFQGKALDNSSHDKKRSRSPMGGLVSRLKNMTTSEASGRGGKSGCCAAAPHPGLPHPSDMPLDDSYSSLHLDSHRRRAQFRKATSAEDQLSVCPKNSYPPLDPSVQVRHRDLFETLNKSMEIEGNVVSALAVAEQSNTRTRRASGPPLISPGGTHSLSNSGKSEVQVTENEKYIIFKSRSKEHSSSVDLLDDIRTESLQDKSRVFTIFMQRHRCYDLIPINSKLLVLDHNMNVKKAFFALVYNGLRAAPLWDSGTQRFVGMLTITDFIVILRTYYKSSMIPMDELESQKISTWRKELSSTLRPFIWISPEASLFDASRLLLDARIHRLPVVDPVSGNVLSILTHKRLLKFLYLNLNQLPLPVWLNYRLEKLKIGTFDNIRTVTEESSLVHALNLFMQHGISSLPVVNQANVLTDIYSKFDVINLASNKAYDNLEITVKQALSYRKDRFEGVVSCTVKDPLVKIIENMVKAEVHRIVVINESSHVVGIVSQSDILSALVLYHDRLAGTDIADGGFITGEPMEMG